MQSPRPKVNLCNGAFLLPAGSVLQLQRSGCRRQKSCKTKSLASEGDFSGSDGRKTPSACSSSVMWGTNCSLDHRAPERCVPGASLSAGRLKQSRAAEPSVTAPGARLCLPSSPPAPDLLTRMIIKGRFVLSAAVATKSRCSAPLRCGGENLVYPWRCTQAGVLLLCSY